MTIDNCTIKVIFCYGNEFKTLPLYEFIEFKDAHGTEAAFHTKGTIVEVIVPEDSPLRNDRNTYNTFYKALIDTLGYEPKMCILETVYEGKKTIEELPHD